MAGPPSARWGRLRTKKERRLAPRLRDIREQLACGYKVHVYLGRARSHVGEPHYERNPVVPLETVSLKSVWIKSKVNTQSRR